MASGHKGVNRGSLGSKGGVYASASSSLGRINGNTEGDNSGLVAGAVAIIIIGAGAYYFFFRK